MRAVRLFAWLFLVACILHGGAAALAQQPPASQPAAEAKAEPLSLRGPSYGKHSWEDDFSYLEGPPGSYKPDLFDPIKWIKLDQNWRLSLGGELRWREEFQTNRTFGANNPAEDSFGLYRAWLHADLSYRKLARVFVEAIEAGFDNVDLPRQANQVNRFDLHQLFSDHRILGEETPLTLRLGRQTISFGRERLWEKGNWGNAGRKFDGARLMWRGSEFDVDVFYVKPALLSLDPLEPPQRPKVYEGLDRKPDHYREQQQVYGIYSVYKGIPRHTIDLYFIGLNDSGMLVNANGRPGDQSIYTLGSRLAGTTAGFDYDTELAGQFGRWAGAVVQAWMWAADGGYTFKDAPWKPRIGAGFDFASGDRDPGDNAHQTFNQLFHQGPPFFGYEQLVGLQNVVAAEANLTLMPLRGVTLKASYDHFWLEQERDALYNSGGGVSRRAPGGVGGKEVGDLFNVTANWQIDVHSTLLVGFEHFWPDHFINRTGPSQDANLFFIQYVLRF